jgi:2-oxoglutarate dehydrogenase E1 component
LEEAKLAVPESTEDSSRSGFGANEWLVDEMYERYQKDPDSVDKVWWDFFGKDQRQGSRSATGQATRKDNGAASTNGTVTESTGAPKHRPAPEKADGKADAKADGKSAERADTKSEAKPEARKAPEPAKKAEQKPTEKKAEKSPSVQSDSKSNGKSATKSAATSNDKSVSKSPEKVEEESKDEPTYVVLKGAPARTVTNMDASLTVPTATSVRSVPVKLLWDNRIVINNHLARARGGKVSFTHLIGFALVRALKAMPSMNVGFDVVDGKPNLIEPAHVNLGLAIDMK